MKGNGPSPKVPKTSDKPTASHTSAMSLLRRRSQGTSGARQTNVCASKPRADAGAVASRQHGAAARASVTAASTLANMSSAASPRTQPSGRRLQATDFTRDKREVRPGEGSDDNDARMDEDEEDEEEDFDDNDGDDDDSAEKADEQSDIVEQLDNDGHAVSSSENSKKVATTTMKAFRGEKGEEQKDV